MQLRISFLTGRALVVACSPYDSISAIADQVAQAVITPHRNIELCDVAGGRLPPSAVVQDLELSDGDVLRVAMRLSAGKGGFGSNLKSAGMP